MSESLYALKQIKEDVGLPNSSNFTNINSPINIGMIYSTGLTGNNVIKLLTAVSFQFL
jgi:hypothetical protein